MSSVIQRAAAVLAAALVAGLAPAAGAQENTRVQKAEGKFVAFDPAAATITVKVKGREVVYDVKPEGSVLTRTTVSMNAAPARLPDLPAGAPVIVYFLPPEAGAERSFARKIDAPKVPEELLDSWD